MVNRLFAVLLVLPVASSLLLAAEPESKAPPELAALTYRNVGPYAGGRVSRACGVPGDPLTYYAATASGGVWKSADGGASWKPIFDDQPTSSIGSIAVAASDPNVVYVGSGEANIRGNVSPGAGIFKSDDAGKTWKHVWKQSGQIGTMAIHPANPDVAFAAVLGRAFGPNKERGVYRTKDGGKTWENVCFKNDEAGCSDVCIDPNNPRIVYAGFWQTRRRPWDLTSGGPGSDLFVSRDGGDTWTSLKPKEKAEKSENGLPLGIWGKVAIAIAPTNSQRIYACIEADKGGLFRSDDGGEKWELVSDDRNIRQRAWYYSTLTPHPTNPDVIYAPQVSMMKSIDGGRNWKKIPGFHHGDHHDLWIDPKNPQRMINANDGGVDISTDGGKSWFAPPLPISQFYHVHADTSTPYRVMGCMQDLGSASGPSHSLAGRIGVGDWHSVGGGEAGHAVSNPRDPNIVYAGEYGGIMTKYDHRTRQARNITINQVNPSGIDPFKLKYRFNWTSPIVVSVHDPKVVYHAANFVFRTSNDGDTWDKISPDLTRNDKQKQQWSGGPITGDNTGAEMYCTIFALAESPKQAGLLWAGSDDGRVHITRNEGKAWTEVTANIPGLPDWGTVTCIEPSPHDAGTAYLVIDNHRMDDDRPYAWKTTDFGKTWTPITEGLDKTVHAKVIREDPKTKGLLFLGTERGVMTSADAGKSWTSLQLNLPTVPVHDLVVKNDDLVVGTHGRSIWILDDITAIRETTNAIKTKPLHLFSIRPTTRWYLGGGAITNHHRGSSAPNPPVGAAIWYSFAKEPTTEVVLEVLSGIGMVVAKAKFQPKANSKNSPEADDDEDSGEKKERKLDAKAGLNRFVWDLTHEGAETIPGSPADLGSPGAGVPVAPGRYTIRIKMGNQTQMQFVQVLPDPRVKELVTASVQPAVEERLRTTKVDPAQIPEKYRGKVRDYFSNLETDKQLADSAKEQQELALRVRNDISRLTETVLRIRSIQKQIKLHEELFKNQDSAKALLKDEEVFGKKLATLEEKLHNAKAKISYDIFAARGGAMLYSQYAWLLTNLIDGDGSPTKAQRELADDLAKQLNGLIGQLDQLLKSDLAKLNAAAKKAELPQLFVPPVKKSAD